MSTRREDLLALHDAISVGLDRIKKFFKDSNKVKITVVVRSPHLADSDVVVGDDDYDEVIAAINRLRGREPIR